MANWTEDELRTIADANELRIAPVRRNGELRSPTTIWGVRAGDDVFVRAAYGPRTGWYRVATRSRQGRLRADGVERDVTVEDADPGMLDAVDAAYREKYARFPANVVNSVVADDARQRTLRLVPRS